MQEKCHRSGLTSLFQKLKKKKKNLKTYLVYEAKINSNILYIQTLGPYNSQIGGDKNIKF